MFSTPQDDLVLSIQSPAPSEPAIKDWTVMVYLAGDNNLSEHMAFSLEGLAKFGTSMSDEQRSKMNVLAYFDGASPTAPTMYFDYTDTGPDRLPFYQPVSGENSASAKAVLDFIGWCTAEHAENGRSRKARNYALIFSGHSLGFHGNTFLRDDSADEHFTLSDFRKVLETANEHYLDDAEGGRIAILGFDTCLMSMLEVGYELKNVARTLVASQGSLPNTGWGYANMLSDFAVAISSSRDQTHTEQVQIAAGSLVRSFTNYHKSLAVGGRSIDISAWNLDRVGTLAEKVSELGSKLRQALLPDTLLGAGERLHGVRNELRKVLLQSHYDTQTYMENQCIDVKDFCQRLAEECSLSEGEPSTVLRDIASVCDSVSEAVDDCVIKCGFSGDAYQFSNGISAYFPWSSYAFASTDSRYRSLRFVSDEDGSQRGGVGAQWYKFLIEYVGSLTLRRARKSRKITFPTSGRYGSIGHGSLLELTTEQSKDSLPFTKDSLPFTKDCLPFTKGVAESGSYLGRFGQFKNYELGWDIHGFADETVEETAAGNVRD